jgi:hypothetical protein
LRDKEVVVAAKVAADAAAATDPSLIAKVMTP